MRRRTVTISLLLALNVICMAQQLLDNKGVERMKAAGLGDDVIISSIQAKAGQYATNVDDLIELKQAGVSDKVISAMISRNAANGTTPVPLAPSIPVDASTAGTSTNAVSSGPATLPSPEKPRVFLQSASHGTNQNAARDQSMEMSKDFERNCPGVRISLNQTLADYTVALNHIEVGFVRDNQFQIADKNGDLISKTKEGGSISGGVKKVCSILLSDWTSRPR